MAARAFLRDSGKLRLRMEPLAGGNAYEITTKCFINRFDIPTSLARVSVLIEPADPMKVAVA